MPALQPVRGDRSGIIARSYPGSRGLHLNEDIAVYEPVDAANRPVAPGTRASKLLLTNVINHALPLIRYELTDEITVLDEPNPDPWTGRRIADIEGRSDDVFTYDHVEVHPYVFRSAIGRRREVLEFQVRQTVTAPTSRCARHPRSTPMRSPTRSSTRLRRSASTRRTCA